MIALIDCGSQKSPAIAEQLQALNTPFQCIELEEWSNETAFLPHWKGIIISGSPILLTYKENWCHLPKFAFVKEVEIPVLGICFGHQVIGLQFGANVYLGKPNRQEADVFFSGATSPLLKDLPIHSQSFAEDHTEGVHLPICFELLGYSREYPVEAMQHAFKKIYGVQFHPEISGEAGSKVIKNFWELCIS